MQGMAITFEPKDFLHIKEVERARGIWREGRAVGAGRRGTWNCSGRRILSLAELGRVCCASSAKSLHLSEPLIFHW